MVRDNHLTDPETSRDLFGVVRGRCTSCESCGRYVVYTEKYTARSVSIHPDCNVALLDCSRCGCSAEVHAVDESGTSRERGNDAMALGEFDSAIVSYTQALACNHVDWRLYSNRSLCYAKKGWYEQAFIDAEKAVALNPDYYKCYFRLATALVGLGRYEDGLKSCRQAMACLAGKGEDENERAVRALEMDIRAKLGRKERKGRAGAGRKPDEQGQETDSRRKEKDGAECIDAENISQQEVGGLERTLRRLEVAVNALVDGQRRQDIRMARIEDLFGRLFEENQTQEEVEEKIGEGAEVAEVGPEPRKGGEEGTETGGECSECGEEYDDVEDVETISEASDGSCSSDFSDAIADIQRAWEEKLGNRMENVCPSPPEPWVQPKAEEQSSNQAASVASSAGVSRKSTGTLQDEARQQRIEASRERILHAEESGELLMSTDLDMLSQQRRTTCESCSVCPGFRILYSSTDVHDTEIMFYCSECGCASEEHQVDQAFVRRQAAEREKEERAARERAARAKGRGEGVGNKRLEALSVLGLDHAATAAEVRAAFRRLAKAYHPDKATSDSVEYSQQMFVRIREARDVLLGNTG